MSRAPARLSLVFLVMLAPPTLAAAAELRASLSGGVGYDSNVFRQEKDPESDANFRINPRIQFRENEGRLQYRFDYSAIWEKYLKRKVADNITDWDQAARGNITYALTPRTQIFVDDGFRYTTNLNNVATVFDPEEPPLIEQGRFKTLINTVTGGLTHRFNSRITGNFAASYNVFNSQRPTSINSQQYAGFGNVDYRINGDYTVGLGGSFVYQDFDETFQSPSADTQILQIQGIFARSLGEHTSLRLSVGPAFIFSKQSARVTDADLPNIYPNAGIDLATGAYLVPNPELCGATIPVYTAKDCGDTRTYVQIPNDQPDDPFSPWHVINTAPGVTVRAVDLGGDNTRVTLFGRAALVRSWTPRLTSSLSYSRRQGQAQGEGTTTIRDVVSFDNTWLVGENWSFQLRAAWVQRNSINPQTRQGLGIRTVIVDTTPLVQYTGSVLGVSKKVKWTRWQVGLHTDRRLTRHFSLILDLIYANQESNSIQEIVTNRSFDEFLAVLSLRYNFDPLRVPIPGV